MGFGAMGVGSALIGIALGSPMLGYGVGIVGVAFLFGMMALILPAD